MKEENKKIKLRLSYFEHAKRFNNVRKACRYLGISPTTYYKWLNRYRCNGEDGLKDRSKRPKRILRQTPNDIVEKILFLRQKHSFGPQKISMYLKRFEQFNISTKGVYYVLRRHNLNRLPTNKRNKTRHNYFYEHSIPGCQLQIDVKFIKTKNGNKLYQFGAIDDFTRIRFLKIYPRNTQENAIDFLDYVIKNAPFRIYSIQTDNGPEFQTKFHWYVEEKGISHKYIKPRTPRLNGKIERSFKVDDEEFYKNLVILDKEHIEKRIKEWENYYNFYRPHGSLNGMTPFERLKSFLENIKNGSNNDANTI